MQASVIIPHFNDVVRLERCLSALVPQIAGRDVEIIVADNASTQSIAEVRAAYPQVRFVHEPHPGAAAARNRAVADSTGRWLFFTDADCVPGPDWVVQALALVTPDTTIGGRVDVFDETPPPRSGAEAFETVFAFPQKVYITRKNYSVTANMLISRAMFDHVGPFDGSRVEDMDWGQRAHAMGYAIRYVPELAVAHPTRQDWPALLKKWRRISSENYFAHGTSPARRLVWGLRGIAILGSIPIHGLKILRDARLSGSEKGAALVVLVRLRLLRLVWTLRQALFSEPPINQPLSSAPAQSPARPLPDGD